MSIDEERNKKRKFASTSSKELLYSEYVGTSVAEHAIELLEAKNYKKPAMKFQKSAVLSRIQNLLPLIEKGEELADKNADVNIENVEEDKPYVEMNVTCINEPVESDAEKENSCSDLEAKENKVNLPPTVEVIENHENQNLCSGDDTSNVDSFSEQLENGSPVHLKKTCIMSELEDGEHSSDCTDSGSSEDSDQEVEILINSCKALRKKKLDRSV
ncbi:uncharacterized protein LOC129219706 [Uloborus diversus]|uniref:uncharacterized protein LOC129219706 n=1 Tax=Uloborus diversus TaxID=327109 RepID=UPI0024094099|nr:uncharacterized protein LOC129219706 [Uloborus diversus]